MEIPNPHFEQYESVVLYWNEKQYKTRIVKRIYDPDRDEWSYELWGVQGVYSADYIEPVIEVEAAQ